MNGLRPQQLSALALPWVSVFTASVECLEGQGTWWLLYCRALAPGTELVHRCLGWPGITTQAKRVWVTSSANKGLVDLEGTVGWSKASWQGARVLNPDEPDFNSQACS